MLVESHGETFVLGAAMDGVLRACDVETGALAGRWRACSPEGELLWCTAGACLDGAAPDAGR